MASFRCDPEKVDSVQLAVRDALQKVCAEKGVKLHEAMLGMMALLVSTAISNGADPAVIVPELLSAALAMEAIGAQLLGPRQDTTVYVDPANAFGPKKAGKA